MDYFIGESSVTVKIDANMQANVFASDIKQGAHTGRHTDLYDLPSPTVANFYAPHSRSGSTVVNAASGTVSWNVGVGGYTPIAILGYDVSKDLGSSGSSRVGTSGVRLVGNTAYWYWRAFATASAKSRSFHITVKILYILSNPSNGPL